MSILFKSLLKQFCQNFPKYQNFCITPATQGCSKLKTNFSQYLIKLDATVLDQLSDIILLNDLYVICLFLIGTECTLELAINTQQIESKQ